MKVIATQLGVWDGHRRRKNAVFDVPDGEVAEWFKPYHGEEIPGPPRIVPTAISELQEAKPKRISGNGRASDQKVI